MKKIDKLILSSFLGPFVLTFLVVDFILLTQYMLKYFDEFIGKDLGVGIFAELIFYFCINMSPKAFPLAVLLSSLMTYGNLGEYSELTAIKGSGISLVRTLVPIFVFVLFLTGFTYYSNNNIVPRANLKAYSLLYDIRKTKPSLDIKEGIFYNGIPNFSINVKKKYPDDILKDVIIYDHSKGVGNTDVILADSGRMYTFFHDQYLMLELYQGRRYSESKSSLQHARTNKSIKSFTRNTFDRSNLVFSLASFDFKKTREELFASSRYMKNLAQLNHDIDSMGQQVFVYKYQLFLGVKGYFSYKMRNWDLPLDMINTKNALDSIRRTKITDSVELAKFERENKIKFMTESQFKRNRGKKHKADSLKSLHKDSTSKKINPVLANLIRGRDQITPKSKKTNSAPAKKVKPKAQETDSTYAPVRTNKENWQIIRKRWSEPKLKAQIAQSALGKARQSKNALKTMSDRMYNFNREINRHYIEKHKKFSEAFACLIMFLIGAPLGAIIKRGGLGFPVIISIIFYVIYYVLSIIGAKWVKEGVIIPFVGIWLANIILFPPGLFFLRQAKNDVRLFDSDYYQVVFSRRWNSFKSFLLRAK